MITMGLYRQSARGTKFCDTLEHYLLISPLFAVLDDHQVHHHNGLIPESD
jgi:hypothetical protein